MIFFKTTLNAFSKKIISPYFYTISLAKSNSDYKVWRIRKRSEHAFFHNGDKKPDSKDSRH